MSTFGTKYKWIPAVFFHYTSNKMVFAYRKHVDQGSDSLLINHIINWYNSKWAHFSISLIINQFLNKNVNKNNFKVKVFWLIKSELVPVFVNLHENTLNKYSFALLFAYYRPKWLNAHKSKAVAVLIMVSSVNKKNCITVKMINEMPL